jgi:hypothetical protein
VPGLGHDQLQRDLLVTEGGKPPTWTFSTGGVQETDMTGAAARRAAAEMP